MWSNRWLFSWLVIDYWRWSMIDRWVIEARTFSGLSITRRLLIIWSVIWLITHSWPIDYSSTIILRTKDTFLVTYLKFVIHFSLLDVFFLVSEVPVDDVEMQSDSQLCNISPSPSLYLITETTIQQPTSLNMKLASTLTRINYMVINFFFLDVHWQSKTDSA